MPTFPSKYPNIFSRRPQRLQLAKKISAEAFFCSRQNSLRSMPGPGSGKEIAAQVLGAYSRQSRAAGKPPQSR